MPTDQRLVTHHLSDGVCTISLDSLANRNALSVTLVTQLHEALDAAERDAARAIVLTHSGPAFCAGADLKERAAGIIDSAPLVRAFQRLGHTAAPTIACVHGAVRAGGVGLMAACDLVVIAPDVTFAFTEVRLGLVPAMITVPLLRRVPRAALVGPFLTAEAFGADQALTLGLVDHVDDDPAAMTARLCQSILQGAPSAVAATKQLLNRVPLLDEAAAYTEMQALSDQCFRSADGLEGMAAARERRPPRWAPTST